ncbi:lipid A export ATP-binding/permease protein MsbA [Striga asiatica]|uniref:Lipid A export ATP-binding/permease protein MsbA n=1 Tax=Striga asiatica TaxID=4170 RepID=A0A5A7P4P2_STRAF|nr:lipid A export ATP-binding/permease protein MsbA [Striga asiatica]
MWWLVVVEVIGDSDARSQTPVFSLWLLIRFPDCLRARPCKPCPNYPSRAPQPTARSKSSSSNRFFSSKKTSQFVCVGPVPPSLSINPLWLKWLLHFPPSLAASEFVESVLVFRQEYRHEKSTSIRIEIIGEEVGFELVEYEEHLVELRQRASLPEKLVMPNIGFGDLAGDLVLLEIEGYEAGQGEEILREAGHGGEVGRSG